jgi:hypothetical protein
MCKKICHLLTFFALVASSSLLAQSFSSADFERLINKHPMMKNYDPESGRFKNTPSQVVPVESVRNQIASAQQEIETFGRQREEILASSLNSENADENKVWEELSSLNEEIFKRKRLLLDLGELEAANGIPPVSRVLSIARSMILDVREEFQDSDVVLNTLPRYFAAPPQFMRNPLQEFFFNPDSKITLLKYLRENHRVGLLFPAVAQPILIGERKKTK